MSEASVTLTIDGKSVTVPAGTVILDAARAAGIEIPNLCYLKELGPYGACGVCVVEVEGCPKLLRACSAKVAEGMKVNTQGDRARATRKLALELLMGDHAGDCVGPCRLHCPAHTDCQKYVAEIADGRFAAAVDTIREVFPLPSSIGRVCPHPCEEACRRQLVEEPISIAALKAFAGDWTRAHAAPPAPFVRTSEKTVGVLGGGPAGLTAAYQLARRGYGVTVYDAMPEMGGMLRYGIPAYRLPKDVLKAETEAIAAAGVTFANGVRLGRDMDLRTLRARHDAVLLACGAWKSMPLGCPGEELAGVFGGIDFLRAVALGERPAIGARTAVVGGGNTAMDACRTAVRLGAKEVSVIYRRTRAEMPAEDVEITEAIEEGVVFRFLTNPAEIRGEGGRVTGVRLQVMELGAPDERGRRRPVPVPGKFEDLPLDSLIVAVGQKNDPVGFEEVPLTAKGTLAADERTFVTALPGVFAAGDAVNRGAGIAIGAIAQANDAVRAIDAWLQGAEVPYVQPVVSVREVTAADFADRAKAPRAKPAVRPAAERRTDFAPVAEILSPEAARAEAKRCLSCGCHDYGECKLIRYANACGADCARFRGALHPGETERRLVTIERNPGKCILCNLCVRVCAETAKKGLLGLVDRGFKTVIRPEFRDPAALAACADCGLCVKNCPTGALRLL